ncbi:MAG TPA: phosphotransferase [Sporichthyaceae bacterium]|jgi:maltokinase|nr:phosphotransferase [Sporichthyaceae bacterium]
MNLDDLAHWLGEQRWFAGRERRIAGVRVGEIGTLSEQPLLRMLMVTVSYADGGEESYQVPVVFHDHPVAELGGALIGNGEGDGAPSFAYDAPYDPAAAATLWSAVVASSRLPGLDFHGEAAVADLPADLPSVVMPAEASNTSIVYGDRVMLKLFRRLTPGLSPDVELSRALQRAGNPYVPAVMGWIDGSWRDSDGTQTAAALAIATEFLNSASGAWELALGSLRALLAEPGKIPTQSGADFSSESYRLGEAVAAIHADLADALGTGEESAAAVAATLTKRLSTAAQAAAALTPYVPGIQERYADLARQTPPLRTQRIHGDLHLGQVLRVPAGWRILDFEGEPGTPVEERRACGSPIRDVAGMLRSFDYVADALLAGPEPTDPATAERARSWVAQNQRCFASGHASQAGAADPLVLQAFMLDKAAYEVVYETRYRPERAGGPLAAIERMLAAGAPESGNHHNGNGTGTGTGSRVHPQSRRETAPPSRGVTDGGAAL